MPSPKRLEHRDEYYLTDDEYFTPDAIRLVEEMLGIFSYIGLRPIAYQLGHRFYHVERKQTFIARTEETLAMCKANMGVSIIWLPSIDEVIRQITYDDMRISMINSGRAPRYIYRTYIFDPLFPAERGYHPFRHTSTDPWLACIFPIAKAYQRRFEVFGIDSFKKTIYTSDKEFADNPTSLIDQQAAVITQRRGMRKKHDRQAHKMEGESRKTTAQ